MATKLIGTSFTSQSITSNQLSSSIVFSPVITSIAICDSSYNVLDDTAANTTGGYIQITGTNFNSNSQIIVGTNTAVSTTYVNSTTLRAQVGAAAASSYPVYVVDSYDGSTAIKVNGLTYSSFPAWSTGATLSNTSANTAFGVNLSATSDSNITYSNTTALPAGTSLLANGYFYGTVSIGVQTVYSFTVDAKDAENQDALRTFSLTVTVNPTPGLYAWGYNNKGQLGTNDVTNRSSPVQISTSTWNALITQTQSQYFTIGLKSNNSLWTWGNNNFGQLGTNDRVYRSSPVQVGALTTWSLISSCNKTAGAIKNDGTLWAWGYNPYGNLGLNDRVYRSSPVQIGALTTWSKLAIGVTHTLAIKTDGTLWGWGQDLYGNLGIPDKVYRSSPVQIGALTNWSSVVAGAGSNASMGIKSDGTLWAIGGTGFGGVLGLNDTNYRSSPVQVGALTNWSKISMGSNWCLSIKTDGTLWAWGSSGGYLGQNDTIYRSSPVQVGALTTWSKISAGEFSNLAIKTDGTLWTWGYNVYGSLGQNNVITLSSPTQIGAGATWNVIAAGYSSMASTI